MRHRACLRPGQGRALRQWRVHVCRERLGHQGVQRHLHQLHNGVNHLVSGKQRLLSALGRFDVLRLRVRR